MTTRGIPTGRLRSALPYRWLVSATVVALGAHLAGGCVEEIPTRPIAQEEHAITAYCTATVVGTGVVDVETDYLPRVVACENGAADFEALKAQAVSARSYLYYKIETSGQIGDGTHDQVYSCGRPPQAQHFRAVEETSGQVLRYNNLTVCAFYVAGAIPSTANCVPAASDPDATNTERYVTYNWGKSGTGITQTTLGWVNAGNYRNRGCKSQNGANCLSKAGRNYRDIINFYYGMDIGLITAEGPCVVPTTCAPLVDADEVIIDDRHTCFVRNGSSSWREANSGHNGHLYWTYVWDQAVDAEARWRLEVTRPDTYDIDVYIEPIGPLSARAPYTVRHSGTETKVTLNLEGQSGWVPLGRFTLASGGDQWVKLNDASGEPYTDTNGKRIVFDAIRLRRALPQPEPEDISPPDTVEQVEVIDESLVEVVEASDLSPVDSAEGEESDATLEPWAEEAAPDGEADAWPDAAELGPESDLGGPIPPTGTQRQSTSDCACALARPAESAIFSRSSWLGLGLGLALIIGWRRRRRRGCPPPIMEA